jgi:hypothetical protein
MALSAGRVPQEGLEGPGSPIFGVSGHGVGSLCLAAEQTASSGGGEGTVLAAQEEGMGGGGTRPAAATRLVAGVRLAASPLLPALNGRW